MSKYFLLPIMLVLILFACSVQEEQNRYTCPAAPDIFVVESDSGSVNVELEIALNSSLFTAPPSFAVWLTFPDGHSQSLYATCKAATGGWDNGTEREGLPVWNSLRQSEGLPDNGPQVDAITSATPTRAFFTLQFEVSEAYYADTLAINLEFNLPGDFNTFYTPNQGSNGQPSLIWRVDFSFDGTQLTEVRASRVIGRSNPAGNDSKIYSDVIGITTAKDLILGMKIEAI